MTRQRSIGLPPAASGDPGLRRPLLVALTALVGAGAVTRVFCGLAATSWAQASGPSPATPADLLALVLAGAGALLTAWLGLGFALAALAALPGAAGAGFALLAERVAPAVVRRAVAFLLGTALTATLVQGPAAAAGAPTPDPHTGTSTSMSAPDPSLRPTTVGPTTVGPTTVEPPTVGPPTVGPPTVGPPTTTVLPGAASPASGPTSRTTSDATPPPAPDPSFRPTAGRPAYTPAAPAPATAPPVLGPLGGAPRAGTSVEEHVVVRRGDTLWDIAARHLGRSATTAEIAHEWPRWHVANRALIGNDPDRLQPGQRLSPPTNAPPTNGDAR